MAKRYTRKLRRRRARGGDENEFVMPKQDMGANDPKVLAPILQARRSLKNPLPNIKPPTKQHEALVRLNTLTPTPKEGGRRKTRRRHK